MENDFSGAFRGRFRGILRWPQLDDLWGRLRADAEGGWYIYTVGEEPPRAPAPGTALLDFLTAIDARLRTEHDEDYCGIVYVDDPERPAMVKIFDPGNLGVVCGSSEQPPLPGWVLSKLPPETLAPAAPSRRGFGGWRRLFSR